MKSQPVGLISYFPSCGVLKMVEVLQKGTKVFLICMRELSTEIASLLIKCLAIKLRQKIDQEEASNLKHFEKKRNLTSEFKRQLLNIPQKKPKPVNLEG